MIWEYFARIEHIIQQFPTIHRSTLNKTAYNDTLGYVSGSLVFSDGSRLDFTEVVDTTKENKVKYRYHYMTEAGQLLFRYDNAPHYPQIATFPHHKHAGQESHVIAATETGLEHVLLEIAYHDKGRQQC